MKKAIFILLSFLICPSFLQAQTLDITWKFSKLYAADAPNGNTHLYYAQQKKRTYSCTQVYEDTSYTNIYSETDNTIHHHNVDSGTDSTLINVYGGVFPGECFGGAGVYIEDFHPFDGRPEHALFAGIYSDGFEPYGFVQVGAYGGYLTPLFDLFEHIHANPNLGKSFFLPRHEETREVPITFNRDSIEAIHSYWYDEYSDSLNKYIDRYDFNLLALSRFKDSLAFFAKDGSIFRTENLGRTADTLDLGFPADSEFFFDSDSSHIYIFSEHQNLLRSDDYGKQESWQEVALPASAGFFSIDTDSSGLIYIAGGTRIFKSSDYGDSFETVFESDKQIKGLYKKPGTDVVFILFEDELVQLTPGELKTLAKTPEVTTIHTRPEALPYHVKENDQFVYTIYKRKVHPDGGSTSTPIEEFKMEVTSVVQNEEGEIIIRTQSDSDRPLYSELTAGPDSSIAASFPVTESEWIFFKNDKKLYQPWVANPENDTLLLYGAYRQLGLRNIFGVMESSTFLDIYIPDKSDTTGLTGTELARIDWSDTFGFQSVYFWEENLRYKLKGAVVNNVVYGDTTRKDIVSNEEPAEIPKQATLRQNYPNPFNPSTVISYQLAGNSLVRLEVFDVTGRKVATLVDGERKPAGTYRVTFGADALSSGVYFYRLVTEKDGTHTKKMTLIK